MVVVVAVAVVVVVVVVALGVASQDSDDEDDAASHSSDDDGLDAPASTPSPADDHDGEPLVDGPPLGDAAPPGHGDDDGDGGRGDGPGDGDPALAPPPPAEPEGGAQARRGERWPPGSATTPWSIAPILRAGVRAGWGATCNLHFNNQEIEAGKNVTCKKQLPYGDLDDRQCKLTVMLWLVSGLDIPVAEDFGRKEHLKVPIRALALPDEQVLVDRALQRFP